MRSQRLGAGKRVTVSITLHDGVAAALLACAAMVCGGCLGDRCGPTEVLTEGYCVAATDAGDDGTASLDGAATAADAGSGETGSVSSGLSLGDACAETTECAFEAGFCLKMPGSAEGYCTIQGCDPAADECPSGYRCIDVSKYVSDIPPLCVRS